MIGRRGALGALLSAVLAGCDRVAQSGPGAAVLGAVERWNLAAHRALANRSALAPEFPPAAISPFFRGNGTQDPGTPDYAAHRAAGFSDWRLSVGGLVARPLLLSLDQLRAMPQRTQITRHDCVEGWSAIGQWTGVPLGHLLRQASLSGQARFIVLRCADTMGGGVPYYESIDLVDAFHPQTIVAHALNGDPLPVRNGAPLRLRVERQLGYKHAKYLTAIEAVDSLQGIHGGKGGYWEDRGYQWYAGI